MENIIHKKINRKIRIRRGSDAQRKLVIFEESEPVFIRDIKRIYAGDQKTYGGKIQTNIFHITQNNNLPQNALTYDIIFNKNENACYVVDLELKMVQMFPETLTLINKIQNDINTIFNLLYRLSTEACNPDLMLKNDSDINIITDDNNRIKVKEYGS